MKIVFIVIYLAIIVFTIGRIFRQIKNPTKTLLWIYTVIFLPVLGLIFFYLVGKNPRKNEFFQQNGPFQNRPHEDIELDRLPKSKHRLIQLLRKNKSASLSFGNEVTVLKDGDETFEHIFKAMRSAQSTIHLDFYIVEEGKMLEECISIFKEKIKNGVEVRLIYDGFGTYELDNKYILELKSIGVECNVFFPFHLFKIFKFINYRNHRKIVIVDNQVAFTGGMNISDKYMEGDQKLGLWRDTFIEVNGPAARDFEQIFKSDWHYANGKNYELSSTPIPKIEVGCPVQVIASGPDSSYKGIMHEYFTIITHALDYVYLVTPYFIPGDSLITALKTTAMSGIDVQIMIPYDSDSKWMKWCMFTYLEELLESGVRIFLFHDGFLHGKVIISDDIVSSIGTANIDDRSFEANFEVNALVYDQSTTLMLKNQFLEDLNHCEELSTETFASRSDRNKVMEPIARLTSSIL